MLTRLTNHWLGLKFASRKLRFGIRSSDLVLDVGGGNNPHFRADVVCEKFIENSAHRQGRLNALAPVVQGDIERLPFQDRVFDFVICTHVLEHVADPVRACRELMRVGKAGYIETPSELNERLFGGGPVHKWLVSLNKQGALVFRQKPRPYMDEWIAEKIWRMGLERNLGLESFRRHNAAALHTMLLWRGAFDCTVISDPAGYQGMQEISTEDDEQAAYVARPNLVRLKRLARLLFARPPISQATLDSLLACPTCLTSLTRIDTTLRCKQCGLVYPVREGIPRLTTTEAKRLA